MLVRLAAWLRGRWTLPVLPEPLSDDSVVSPAEFRRTVLRERARSDRNGGSLALVLVDGGSDRQLSDALESWAPVLAARVRCTDVVGWFDTQTLGVVLPDTDHEGALVVIRQLRSKLPPEAAKAHWRILVHPEHTAGRDEKTPADAAQAGGDPLDLLRAPARPSRLPETESDADGRDVGAGSFGASAPTGTLVRSRRGMSSRVQNAESGTFKAVEVGQVEVAPLRSVLLTPTPPLKRAVDIVGAAVALILLSPLMLAAAVAVRLSSPGPIVFRQKRAGLGGRAFTFFKFRTMYVDAEARKRELLAQNEQSGPVFKMADDPRITPIGRFLRKTTIDELPQLWNVLIGDMSLVGPRPPIVAEVEEYERWQRRRLEIKGGLTCIWQVSGRSAIQFEDWVRLDLRYIENASMWTDATLMARTVPAVLACRGAH